MRRLPKPIFRTITILSSIFTWIANSVELLYQLLLDLLDVLNDIVHFIFDLPANLYGVLLFENFFYNKKGRFTDEEREVFLNKYNPNAFTFKELDYKHSSFIFWIGLLVLILS